MPDFKTVTSPGDDVDQQNLLSAPHPVAIFLIASSAYHKRGRGIFDLKYPACTHAPRALRPEGGRKAAWGSAGQPYALGAVMPQRASAASSLTRASTQRAPCGVSSFFQNGAWVLR